MELVLVFEVLLVEDLLSRDWRSPVTVPVVFLTSELELVLEMVPRAEAPSRALTNVAAFWLVIRPAEERMRPLAKDLR